MAEYPAASPRTPSPRDGELAAPPPPPLASRRAPAVQRGLLAAVAAFFIWGLLPLYLRPLRGVAPLEIMAHRVLWGCLLVLGWLLVKGQLRQVGRALATPSTRRGLLATAVLVSTNWLVFVWAVGAGRVVDASLGYFINPLINVLIGVLFLSERLTPIRWLAVGAATLGVCWLGIAAGQLPWIALVLAFSFAFYGLIRKLIQVDAVVGLAAETALLAPLALGYLAWVHLDGSSTVPAGESWLKLWLMLGGLITAVPLALFAYGARQIPYSTIGLIQYIGPTLQFASGVFIFGEPFSQVRLVGFGLIWTALLLYALEGLLAKKPAEVLPSS